MNDEPNAEQRTLAAVATEPARASEMDFSHESLPSSRVPHLGHALLFVSFSGFLLMLAQLLILSAARDGRQTHDVIDVLLQPKRQLAAQAATYMITLGMCFLVFPILWKRGFLAGINWDGARALRFAMRLVPLGLAAGFSVQAISSLIPMPKSVPMDNFFKTPSDVWIVTAFGTLLAPVFEEIAFRGFLLPAFAIAFDWLVAMLRYLGTYSSARLSGEEPPQHIAVFAEDASAGLVPDTGNLFFRTRAAIVASSIVTSFLFALLHAEQLASARAALVILFCVSLVLTTIRIKARSVACSALVHASYNLSVFLILFVATGGYRHLEKITQ